MSDAEKLLWSSNPFWLKYFWHIIILLIVNLVCLIIGFTISMFWIIVVTAIAFIVLGCWILIQMWKWKRIKYQIYSDEIVFIKGIITKDKLNILVDKIEFYRIKISLTDRLFGTGDILIFTGEEQDEPEATLSDVDNVKKVEGILKQILNA